MTEPPDRRFVGLSCYTSNLACYLAREHSSTASRLAESVRLAVRTDLPDGRLQFSHHGDPLDRVPGGTCLRYAATRDPAIAAGELCDELTAYGAVLVLTDNARLPWSPSHERGPAAPHLLLVDGRHEDRWHVCDAFAGLLALGEQAPYAGWLTTDALLAAMTPPPSWSAVQRDRNELAFGFPVPAPRGGGLWWLRREADDRAPRELHGEWLRDDRSVLEFLAGYVADDPLRAEHHLDDLWVAANLRAFRHRHGDGANRERREAVAVAWEVLPRALRFAVDSARRGRPRRSLVHTTFDHLLDQELLITETNPGP